MQSCVGTRLEQFSQWMTQYYSYRTANNVPDEVVDWIRSELQEVSAAAVHQLLKSHHMGQFYHDELEIRFKLSDSSCLYLPPDAIKFAEIHFGIVSSYFSKHHSSEQRLSYIYVLTEIVELAAQNGVLGDDINFYGRLSSDKVKPQRRVWCDIHRVFTEKATVIQHRWRRYNGEQTRTVIETLLPLSRRLPIEILDNIVHKRYPWLARRCDLPSVA